MKDLDPNVRDWVLEACGAKLPFKLWEYLMFSPAAREQIRRQLPPGAKWKRELPYVYYSANRPVSYTWAKVDLNPHQSVIVDSKDGSHSYILSGEILDPDVLYRLELYPLLDTRGATLMDLLGPEDRPLTGATPGGDRVAVISRDLSSRGWRVTYFEANVGPIGHLETDSETHGLSEMIVAGYTRLVHPSALDEIAATFPER